LALPTSLAELPNYVSRTGREVISDLALRALSATLFR